MQKVADQASLKLPASHPPSMYQMPDEEEQRTSPEKNENVRI